MSYYCKDEYFFIILKKNNRYIKYLFIFATRIIKFLFYKTMLFKIVFKSIINH